MSQCSRHEEWTDRHETASRQWTSVARSGPGGSTAGGPERSLGYRHDSHARGILGRRLASLAAADTLG